MDKQPIFTDATVDGIVDDGIYKFAISVARLDGEELKCGKNILGRKMVLSVNYRFADSDEPPTIFNLALIIRDYYRDRYIDHSVAELAWGRITNTLEFRKRDAIFSRKIDIKKTLNLFFDSVPIFYD